ncbi:MAG TPA: hypothetical protein DCL73_16400 [Treponema sp.]|nr:hypothetical protein [Treponema sp.]
MFFRRLLLVLLFPFPFLCMFYGAYSSDSRAYCSGHGSGSSEFLTRTHDALVPLVTSGSEYTAEKQIRLQKNFASGTEPFYFHVSLIILSLSVVFVSCIHHFADKYLRCVIFLETLK